MKKVKTESFKNFFKKLFHKKNPIQKKNEIFEYDKNTKTLTINDDIHIVIKGNLRIYTEKHIILVTSRKPVNDSSDNVYSIWLNPNFFDKNNEPIYLLNNNVEKKE